MKPHRFLREADSEFQEQIRYFDGQAAGLGDRFIADVDATVQEIRTYPDSGSPLSPILRKRILRVFKHSIYYVNQDDAVVIVAVAPQRRRPGYFRKRLKELT